jgi:uncharacterized protein related to proFAR isomerase
VTGAPPLDPAEIIRMLAAFGDRSPADVDDVVGSLELTWLIAEIEQRHHVVIDLGTDDLDAVHTVTDASRVLGALLRSAATAHPEGPART